MRLLIITQSIDPAHPVLGFFPAWVEAFRAEPGVQVEVIATNGSGSRVGRLWAFWKAIVLHRSDAVFVHMTPVWLVLGWPLWALRGTRTALWYTHGSSSAALRIAVALASVTLTATAQAFPFQSSKVNAVGHGIAPTFGAASRPPRPSDRFAFLAVGRVAPRKRVRETMALFAQIHRLEPRATLTWVGPVQETNEYAAQVTQDLSRLGITDAVQFGVAATAAEMPQLYATHDLLLHLSDTGSLDKVVLEALATGCAVWSTNPATAEGIGEAWMWRGRLDASAAESALQKLQQGVAPTERQRVADAYALAPLIRRITAFLTA